MAANFPAVTRRTGLALAVAVFFFSALVAANATDKSHVGDLSTSQIEDELQVYRTKQSDAQLTNTLP